MLVNLLVLLLWIPSLLGWGMGTRALLGQGIQSYQSEDELNPGVIMILGFVPLAIISTSLHFFFALGGGVSLAILALGYPLLVYEWATVRKNFSPPRVVGAFPIIILVSVFASRPLTHFDTGLYHIQSVKWCTTYPLVRGLANLHERLGFSSVWTPLSAVIDYPRFSDTACFPITCLLLFAFGWAAYVAMMNINGDTQRVEDLFLAACGCFWMWMVVADMGFAILPSLSSDAPIYLSTLLCTYLLLRFCSRKDYLDLFQALAISALAVTSKVSAAPLFLFLLLFSLFTWLRAKTSPSVRTFAWVPVGVLLCSLVGLWVARSIWLSGYLIFPVSSTALTFLPWHLPVPMAEQLVLTLKAWARSPGVDPEIVLADSIWLRGWLVQLFAAEIVYTIVAYALAGGTLLFVARRGGLIKDVLLKSWASGAMLGLGTIYWFITVPDPRYGYGYLFALACLLFSVGFASLQGIKTGLVRALLSCSALIPLMTVSDFSHFHLSDLPRVGAGTNSARQTDQGIPIYVATGDQRILNGPLPSTPYFRSSLLTKSDAEGRILEFDLTKAVNVPYYGIVPAAIRKGLGRR